MVSITNAIVLILLVPKLEYSRRIRSTSRLLMPWALVAPGHSQLWFLHAGQMGSSLPQGSMSTMFTTAKWRNDANTFICYLKWIQHNNSWNNYSSRIIYRHQHTVPIWSTTCFIYKTLFYIYPISSVSNGSRGCLNLKMPYYQHRNSHNKHTVVSLLFYHQEMNPYTWKSGLYIDLFHNNFSPSW